MTASNATQSASTIRRAGAVCLLAALAGAASGVYLAAMDPDVSADRFSYPQGAGELPPSRSSSWSSTSDC